MAGLMSNRRSVRELLMRLIYQMSVTGDWSDEEKKEFLAENAESADSGEGVSPPGKADKAYFDSVACAVRGNIAEIDRVIGGASDHWKIGRIAKVDLSIIRLAVAEMLYVPDIPAAVSINEAVGLAKRYGAEKSYEFVNGVLGRITRNMDAGGEGRKS
jgi:N utilization substance protein B